MAIQLSEPIEAIIGRIHGPHEPRRGDESGRHWWVCPFHDDKNPSLCVTPGSNRYRCFGCGVHGDAIDFIRRFFPGMSFRGAIEVIERRDVEQPFGSHLPSEDPIPQSLVEHPEGWQEFARGVVARGEKLLWDDCGAGARIYLVSRGLSEDTIRRARLGYWPEDQWFAEVLADRTVWLPSGIMIPWFEGSDVALINIRRLGGAPRYVTVSGGRWGGLYPGREGVTYGKPVVIVEGELDALLLGQELGALAPVVTLGMASNLPSAGARSAMLAASPWVVALDADGPGKTATEAWMSISDRCAAVAPPGGMGKDWTEAFQHGLDLSGYWRKVLDRITGRSTSMPELDPSSSSLSDAIVDSPEAHSVVDDMDFEPPAHPWRYRIGMWPPDWRRRWGALANSYSHSGMSWSEAEIRAANEVTIEKEAAGGGPAPQPDTDPHAALQRDFLEEMFASGEAERFLSPAELRDARRSLLAKPLDYNGIQPFVAKVMSRSRDERHRTLGIPEVPAQGRWICGNSFCRDKSRWWLSEHGVVNCRNCCPASPCTRVVAEGDSQDAPLVEPGQSHQIQIPFAGRPPTT